MPWTAGTYVRYWDGRAVAYGKIQAINGDGTYDIRIGGTDRVRKVREGDISVHPTAVACGRMGGAWTIQPQAVPDPNKWLYHATATDLVGPIAQQGGLMPRSAVDWKKLGDGVWQGAERGAGRVQSTEVRMAEYFAELATAASGLATVGAEDREWYRTTYEQRLMGDVGEYVYAAPSVGTAVGYAKDISAKGKKIALFRFRASVARTWYKDPKEAAWMAVTAIAARDLQVKYIPQASLVAARRFDHGAEDALDALVLDNNNWHSCEEAGWHEVIDLEAAFDF